MNETSQMWINYILFGIRSEITHKNFQLFNFEWIKWQIQSNLEQQKDEKQTINASICSGFCVRFRFDKTVPTFHFDRLVLLYRIYLISLSNRPKKNLFSLHLSWPNNFTFVQSFHVQNKNKNQSKVVISATGMNHRLDYEFRTVVIWNFINIHSQPKIAFGRNADFIQHFSFYFRLRNFQRNSQNFLFNEIRLFLMGFLWSIEIKTENIYRDDILCVLMTHFNAINFKT